MAWLPDPVKLFWKDRHANTYLKIVFVLYGIVHAILPGEAFFVDYMRDDIKLNSHLVHALLMTEYMHSLNER